MTQRSRTAGPEKPASTPDIPSADQRFLEAVEYILAHKWAPSERRLNLDLGLSVMVIYKVRKGKQRYPKTVLPKLEALYGINAHYIMTGEGQLVAGPPKLPGHQLALYLKRVGMSEGDFLQAIDLSKPEAKRLLEPTNQPTTAQLRSLKDLFPTLDIHWLLNGSGEPDIPTQPAFVPGPLPSPKGVLGPKGSTSRLTSAGFRLPRVPLIDFRARGTFTNDEHIGQAQDRLDQVAVPVVGLGTPLKPDRLTVIRLEGESMQPTLAPGEYLLVEQVAPTDWPYLNAGVYLVEYGEAAVVKRVRQNEIMSRGRLTLHSDNLTYGTLEVPADEIRTIARVVQAIRPI